MSDFEIVPDINKREQSPTSIAQYNTCPAKYYLRYGLKLEDNLWEYQKQRGTCVHAGFEAWLLGQDVSQAVMLIDEPDISMAIREEALGIVNTYLPYLPAMQPYLYDGKPAVELEFSVPIGEASLRGKVDAVVLLDGKVTLIDWKARASSDKFYSDTDMKFDRQLAIYTYALRSMGIPVEQAFQVQMSAKLPSRPRVYAGKKGVTIEEWIERVGKTTSRTLKAALSGAPEDILMDLNLKYSSSLVPDTDFIRFTEVDVRPERLDWVAYYTAKQIAVIEQDGLFLPILDTYQCKGCGYKEVCAVENNL